MMRLNAATLAATHGHASLLPVAPYHPAFCGSEGQNLYAGWPNLSGLHFAALARAGYGGLPDLLEAPNGLAQALGWTGDRALLIKGVCRASGRTSPFSKPTSSRILAAAGCMHRSGACWT
ncbi:hypothetical protein [Roseomonas populi]|uniref:Uncharacterized protein n=1 Tax=Roseomonas populi TaxID=3121582 RepID=A0ABT1XDS6_9PROT|nr:hypothetical protein [Roseomonas pecuniae]MCR0985593.1 hypothetical protein [Roseomonas pecuniae]